MKKILALILAATTAVSFASCGKDTNNGFSSLNNDVGGISGMLTPEEHIPQTPEEYLKFVLLENNDIGAALKTSIDNSKKNSDNVSGSAKLDLTIGNGFKSFLTACGDNGEVFEAISWLKNANLSFDTDIRDNNLFKIAAKLGINDTHIASADVTAVMDSGEIYLSVPELTSATAMVEAPELAEIYEQTLPGAGFLSYIPDGATAERIYNKYIEIIVGNIDEVEKTNAQLTAGGITTEATKLDIVVEHEDALRIAEDVIEAALADPDIRTIITAFSQGNELWVYDYESADEMVADIYNNMEETLEDIRNTEPTEGDNLDIAIYTDDSHNIIGFEAYAEEEEILAYRYAENNNAFALVFSVDGDTLVRGNGNISNKILSGTFEIFNDDSEKIVTFQLSEFNIAAIEEGLARGTISVKLAPEFIEENYIDAFLADCELVLSLSQTDDTNSQSTLTFNYKGQEVATLKIQSTKKQPSGITIPQNAVNIMDEASAEAFVSTLKFDTIFSNLNNAGAMSFIMMLAGF